ncbi:hypothetical protein TD95_003927 [Thielaviopsis punctulata]|uniref:J domain-containing protein n=1 Tax=Thielaviopsis punctulata TaxID=72032 RepID=A0A0F4ZCH0_9PEZI|nr:hypothetical protein TD95_003927 [Thielaviopsis punctulata]
MSYLIATGRRQTARACKSLTALSAVTPASPPHAACLPLFSSPAPPTRYLHQTAIRRDTTATGTAPRTHYDIFPATLPAGPPPRGHFPIDVRALRREFLQLQAQAHPDLHPAKDKVRAQAMSALINEAYKTLANPLLRAQYLLGLRGINPAEDERARVDSPELLMTVMEVHEEIQEATREEDLHAANEANEQRIRESEDVLEKAFREDDMEAAVEESIRMRYWVNIRESIQNWEPGKVASVQH